MNAALLRREAAYWLTLAFRLEREPRRHLNGLVLTADRLLKLGLSALVDLEPGHLPEPLQRYTDVHRRLVEAEGRVSAQAFVVDRLLEEGIQVVPITAGSYPGHLARTLSPNKAPTLLSAAGNVDLLKEPGVAVCGSREAGASGLAFARAAGRALAEAGMTVVSGLARGCDREAMEGALEAGGRVIGVLAEGILQSSARKRPEVEAGRLTVVSEFAPSEKWSVARAMSRNHTIAGFSRALMVADCVGQGGTTDQVEVGRSLSLPVLVRRGRGEGALVGELVRRSGVTALEWDEGAVHLPAFLGSRQTRSGIRCDIQWLQEQVVVHLEAPRHLTLDALLDAVREAWQRESGGAPAANKELYRHDAEPGVVAAHDGGTPEPQQKELPPSKADVDPAASAAEGGPEKKSSRRKKQPGSSAAAASQGPNKLGAILRVLEAAGAEGRTVEQLRDAVGGAEKTLRRLLHELQSQDAIATARKPRPHRYFLKSMAPRDSLESGSPTPEGKQKEKELMVGKSQLGLVLQFSPHES